MRRAAYTLLICIALLSACGGTLYDHYEHAPIGGWDKNEAMNFHVPAMADDVHCTEQVGLRIDNSFPFMSLTLIVETTVTPSGKVYRDTIAPLLINRNGHATGSGINNHQYTVPVRELSLSVDDSLTISVRHDMKREVMPGITDVGVILTRH